MLGIVVHYGVLMIGLFVSCGYALLCLTGQYTVTKREEIVGYAADDAQKKRIYKTTYNILI